MSIESIANALGGAKRTPEGYLCRCPCHDDKTASLSITQKENGAYIYNCFAGCKWQDIQAVLLRQNLIQPRNGTPYDKYQGAKFYTYYDNTGKILCRKVKMPDKKMWFERYENNTYIPGLNGMTVPLYNIRAVNESNTIYLCEGEKDAESLISRGLIATTNHAGAKSWHPQYTEALRNKTVIVIPDNDEAGRKRIDILTNALRANVKELYLFMPDGVEEHGDITDWINNGNDAHTILQKAECIKRSHEIVAITATEAMFCELSPPNQILKDLWDISDKMAVIGHSKTRKTFFILQLALSLATGTQFLGFEVMRKRKVLIVQYEVQRDHFLRRYRRMCECLNITVDDLEDRLLIINSRGKTQDFDKLKEFIKKNQIEVVMFDPFYKLFIGDESDSEEIKRILGIFDSIVNEGCGLLYVHHDKKGSSERTEQRDRGSGAGILARDYDCSFAISEHDVNPDAIVIDILQRNYLQRDSLTAEWVNGSFIESELQPIVKKAGRRTLAFDLDAVSASALELLANGAMDCVKFREAIRRTLGATRSQERDIVYKLLQMGAIKEIPSNARHGIPKKFTLAESVKVEVPEYTDKLF